MISAISVQSGSGLASRGGRRRVGGRTAPGRWRPVRPGRRVGRRPQRPGRRRGGRVQVHDEGLLAPDEERPRAVAEPLGGLGQGKLVASGRARQITRARRSSSSLTGPGCRVYRCTTHPQPAGGRATGGRATGRRDPGAGFAVVLMSGEATHLAWPPGVAHRSESLCDHRAVCRAENSGIWWFAPKMACLVAV